MIVWLALLIPAATAAALYWRFQKRIAPWELALMVAVPAVLVVASKFLVEVGMTADTEYWGGWVMRAEHYEAWNERVSCRHPRMVSETYTTTDSKGRTVTRTRMVQRGWLHAYDVDDHDEYWQLRASTNDTERISQAEFNRLVGRFGNRKFVDLHRNYHTVDGDKYVTEWPGDDPTLEAFTAKRSYENRVAVSDSVFNFPEVDPGDFGLFEYPPVAGGRQRCLLGHADADAARKIDLINARLGAKKQVRCFVLVFPGKPLQAAVDQESYWKGGNKNEFVTCVGTDGAGAVSWAYVFSWSEAEQLKVEARNVLVGQGALDLGAYLDWLRPALDERFVRKPFADFSYLTVSPPGWAVGLVYLLTALACGGLGAFVVLNDTDGDGRSRRWKERGARWGRIGS